jgi:two-component system phosphate regulon sensor histidine kinase PhoR
MVTLLVGAGLLSALAAAMVAHSVTRPLSRTAAAVLRLGSKSALSLPESGPAEVREISRALNLMAQDLAARIQALQRETEVREQILSSMAEGVALADQAGELIYANPPARDFLGPTRFLPAHLAQPGHAELTLYHPAKRELTAACIRLDDGRMVVVLQDVTETKRTESVRRDFVANASHELKTPVAAIQAVAETLEWAIQDDAEAAVRFTDVLLAETHRLSAIVQDLLDLARLEGKPPIRERVSLTKVVRSESERARRPARVKGLRLEEAAFQEVEVMGNAEDLALAVRNLLENAVQYTTAGRVSVRLRAIDGRALVEVEDTGVGIPAGDLTRIFERFFRIDKARSRETGGTGLGLSIVRHVVEQHGGEVRAESELGQGSRFTISLPLAQSGEAARVPS